MRTEEEIRAELKQRKGTKNHPSKTYNAFDDQREAYWIKILEWVLNDKGEKH